MGLLGVYSMPLIKKIFKSYLFNILLMVLFTIGVLYFTLRDNFSQVMHSLSNINPLWIVLIVTMSLLIHWWVGMILTQLARLSKPDYQYHQGFINALIAAFFHGITPSASGGQFAQVYVFRKQGVKISDSMSVLLMDFILYQSVLVAMSLLFLLLRYDYFVTRFSHAIWLVLGGFLLDSVVIGGLYALTVSPKLYRWVMMNGIDLGAKLKIVKDPEVSRSKMHETLENFNQEITRLKTNKPLMIKVLLLNVVRLLTYYSIPVFCYLALGLKLDYVKVFDIIVLTSFVSVMNHMVPIPGASGSTEASFIIFLYSQMGYVVTVSAGMMWRFATFHLILMIGGLLFVVYKSRNNSQGG
jgi:glycosyltransferase 2 family protein